MIADRGSRVGYRLVLDNPGRVTRFASLAIVPTLDVMDSMTYAFARDNYHWFLLAQDGGLPERLLATAPDEVIDRALAKMGAGDRDDVIEPAARDAYRKAFRDPHVRHAMCEDYRAALEEDLRMDREDRAAGRKLDCPVHVVSPHAEGANDGPGPLEIWSRWADDVTASSTTGGHLQAEDRPEEVLAALGSFFAAPAL